MQYSEQFRRKMIQKMTGPQPVSATALARQVDIPQPTLSKWLRQTGIPSPYAGSNKPQGESMAARKTDQKSPKDWTAQEKFTIVMEAQNIPDDQLGAFLRTHGLHETHLQQWRAQILDALSSRVPAAKRKARSSTEGREIKKLEKELRRKDKALAEAAALLVLKKKVQEIWGDGGDGTTRRNGK